MLLSLYSKCRQYGFALFGVHPCVGAFLYRYSSLDQARKERKWHSGVVRPIPLYLLIDPVGSTGTDSLPFTAEMYFRVLFVYFGA